MAAARSETLSFFRIEETVGHHVSALLAKLGVGSRRQAVTAARRLGVVPAKDREPGGQR
jgi:hypothetical protein